MKYLNFTSIMLLAIMSLSVSSCEKEKPLDEAIIGKWEVISMDQVTYENNVKKSEVILYIESGKMSYQFIEGGSGIYSEDADDYLFSWSLNGSELTLENLYTEDLVVVAAIDNSNLVWSYNQNDPQNASKKYEYIMTAKRIN
jgi:uncharacterized lipoprotein YehR (DUF1307 family)